MKDDLIFTDKWVFDKKVADCFEDMLERSIPQYNIMRKAVFDLASYKIKNMPKFNLLDIGCSDGLSLEQFVIEHFEKGKFVGIDVSEDMLCKARERFEKYSNASIEIKNVDLRNDFPNDNFDIITSVLCILFTPIQYRQNIIQNIYNHLNDDGMFIMVEKVLGNTANIDNMMVDLYYNMKKDNGYSEEQILRKKLSLEGVQVPVTSNWNIDLLKQAGFKQVDVFWRWMNFEGYIAFK